MTIVVLDGKAYLLGEEVTIKVVQSTSGLTYAEKTCVELGRNIQAIRSVRERTGLGLREAKDLCDAYRATLPPAAVA